jgi:hypothetical protein
MQKRQTLVCAASGISIAVADGNESVSSRALSLLTSDQRQSAACVEAAEWSNHLDERIMLIHSFDSDLLCVGDWN